MTGDAFGKTTTVDTSVKKRFENENELLRAGQKSYYLNLISQTIVRFATD
jgi:hypothetical protein